MGQLIQTRLTKGVS